VTLAGTRLGPYQIAAVVGIGGMGEVYRAHDSRLSRDVALKMLPAAFRSDPDRLSRFEREARALAALNHPNIATIYGLEQHDGIHVLVLELIDGQTLAEIIDGVVQTRQRMPIIQTSGIGNQGWARLVESGLRPQRLIAYGWPSPES
jgi:serine/threonine protein kinase